jgi:hypothetical protein
LRVHGGEHGRGGHRRGRCVRIIGEFGKQRGEAFFVAVEFRPGQIWPGE